jgi:FecR protein
MVPNSRRFLTLASLAAFSGFGAFAQSVISTHSGVLHLSEGAVFANEQPVNQKYGTFPDLKENSVLRTEMGRAEVLLTPGVFLRIGENSSIKMIDNRLVDTRVELIKGTAVVECDDPMKENAVTMIYKDYQVHVRKASVMEFVSDPAELKVYHGEAEVELNGQIAVVKAGKQMPFTQALAQERFDVKNDGDELTRWSQERSEAVAVANVSAAKSLRDSGGSLGSGSFYGGMFNGMYGNGIMPYGSWYYNPYYSMYTYLPLNGMFMNPYGYGFFSPFTVYQVYVPGYYYSPGSRGTTTGTSTSSVNRPGRGVVALGLARPSSSGFNGRSGSVANPVNSGSTAVSTMSPVASPASMGNSSASVGGRSVGRGK